MFENFIKIYGSKLLIGRNLVMMASVLVTDTIDTIKSKLTRKAPSNQYTNAFKTMKTTIKQVGFEDVQKTDYRRKPAIT